jgi:gamma-glutamylcysteine synthetase
MITVGVELEFFVYTSSTQFDLYDLLIKKYGGDSINLGGDIVSTDAGRHQMEISYAPVEIGLNDVLEINYWEERFKYIVNEVGLENCMFIFSGVDPLLFERGIIPKWAPKERYRALIEALSIEKNDGVKIVSGLSAFQAHFPVLFVDINVVNVINNWAPLLTRIECTCPIEKCELCGLKHCFRLRKWKGWADLRRLPHLFWFRSEKELEDYMSSIPQLIVQNEKGWRPHLGQVNNWLVHEASIWWFVRKRIKFNTYEIRFFDSVHPSRIPLLVRKLVSLITRLKENTLSLPLIKRDEWWRLFDDQCVFDESVLKILEMWEGV